MSSRKKAKGGSVTDDMPSPSMLDGAALGATLDRIRVHCTTCDRPVATPREETTPRDQQNPAICYFNGGLACHKNEVDWRARCLAAEAESDRLRKLFDDAGQGEHNILALIDHYQDEEHREYRLRIAAEEVAGRALVEGLKECERLRAMASTLSAFDILIGAPSKEMTEADLVEAMARLVTDPPSPMMDAREGAAAREQAIRADAAREERERVVAMLRAMSSMRASDAADVIEAWDSAARAPGAGKGGV